MRVKWIGGVAQAIECLLCKPKALNSNPVPPTKLNEGIYVRKKKIITIPYLVENFPIPLNGCVIFYWIIYHNLLD
jgi:hypothetical protein